MTNEKKDLLIKMVSSALEDIINQNTLDFEGVKFWTESATEDEVSTIVELLCKFKLDAFLNGILGLAKVDTDFKFGLCDFMKSNFSTDMISGDKEQCIAYFKNNETHRQDIMDVLSESDTLSVVSEELQDDIVDDWFENADASDITNRCSSSQELDLEDYFLDNFKERAKDAIENM